MLKSRDTLKSLRARIAEMTEALKPFAHMPLGYQRHGPRQTVHLEIGMPLVTFTAEDVQRARRLTGEDYQTWKRAQDSRRDPR